MLNRRRTRSEVCLIMLDIDHFKHVNDTYGHPTGDTVICKITEICQQTLMRTSDVFARFGGEEFVVMLPGADIDSAILVAEKLRAAIEDCAFYDNQGVQFRVTVSLGVACSMAGDVDEVPMLARADAALYQAKKGGRNCVR